jgi:hypothetical protein
MVLPTGFINAAAYILYNMTSSTMLLRSAQFLKSIYLILQE